MKAAVVHEVGATPQYEAFPDPVAGENEVLISVKAVAVENLDKEIVAGAHFTAESFIKSLPGIPCFDGVDELADGTLVGFGGCQPPYGALAERTVVPAEYANAIPEGLDPAVAVALASAVTGFAIETAGDFEPGQTVLIQGATGVAGRLAVQVAKKLGAERVVATGRRDAALADVAELGADATINTAVPDQELIAAYNTHAGSGYDVVLDFLWGRPTQLLLAALIPESLGFAPPVRLIQVGASAGEEITLPARAVRTSGVEIVGATRNLTAGKMSAAYQQTVDWARSGELEFNIARANLSDIETEWLREDLSGKRLVVMP